MRVWPRWGQKQIGPPFRSRFSVLVRQPWPVFSSSLSVCFSRPTVKTINRARCAIASPSGSVVFLFPRCYLISSAALSTFRQLANTRPHQRPLSPTHVCHRHRHHHHHHHHSRLAAISLASRGLGSPISPSNPFSELTCYNTSLPEQGN